MELKLYNRLKRELLRDLYQSAEGNDRAYQQQVEAFASRQHSGLPGGRCWQKCRSGAS